MQIHELKRNTPNKKSARVGRGGKRGKTSGKGMKGQNSRSNTKKRPEIRDMIKKLPKMRGHGKNRARTVNSSVVKPGVVNVGALESLFDAGIEINPEILLTAGLVRRNKGRAPKVKILGNGNITKKFTFSSVIVSDTAKEKIEKAGGSIK